MIVLLAGLVTLLLNFVAAVVIVRINDRTVKQAEERLKAEQQEQRRILDVQKRTLGDIREDMSNCSEIHKVTAARDGALAAITHPSLFVEE